MLFIKSMLKKYIYQPLFHFSIIPKKGHSTNGLMMQGPPKIPSPPPFLFLKVISILENCETSDQSIQRNLYGLKTLNSVEGGRHRGRVGGATSTLK